MNIRKKTIGVLFLAVTAAGMLSGCRIGNTEYLLREPKVVEDHSVFSVNGQKCELPEAMIYLCNYKNLYGSEYGINLWNYDFGEESLEAYIKDVALNEVIRVICMDILATEQGIALDEADEAAAKKAAEAYYKTLSEEEIAFMDVKESDIELAYEHYALAMKLYHILTNGVEKEVSDDEARVIRIQQIYITDKDNAKLVAEKLQDGEDFAAAAGTYNEADSIEILVARGDLPECVEEVAFNLDNGAFSDMVEAEDCYYFIRCLNKFEEELTEENKDVIRERRKKEQFEDVYDAFVANAVYQCNEDVWRDIALEGNEETVTTSEFFRCYAEYFHE